MLNCFSNILNFILNACQQYTVAMFQSNYKLHINLHIEMYLGQVNINVNSNALSINCNYVSKIITINSHLLIYIFA